jgi:hypothetical protein
MKDVRTAVSALSIDPVLIRSVCCPKCFAPYTPDNLPDLCTRRESPRSRKCGETLCMERMTKKGSRRAPHRLYSTQSFDSWLRRFLLCPRIEKAMEASYLPRPADSIMRDLYDSPAWKSSLGTFTQTVGNLTFSYYIDWFNPFTNKIAGKKVSCGAIMMTCLNLPPELRGCLKNVYFAGLTPPPKEPDIVTITSVQDPIIREVNSLFQG